MRRLCWVLLALPIACSDISKVEAGSTTNYYRPMGIGVHQGHLLVVSSNSDLRYDGDTGGSVIAVDPSADPAAWLGGININSFAAELAVADSARCNLPGSLGLVPVRGTDVLYRIAIDAAGGLSCGAGCELPLGGQGATDPFAIGVACDGAGFARAYVGYLRSVGGLAWITQVDLTKADSADGAVQHQSYGIGQMRGFAFDAERKRLYAAQTTTGVSTSVRYVDLLGGCRIDAESSSPDRCRGGAAALWPGIEPRALALSRAGGPEPFRRMYVSARVFDPSAAASVGVRVGEAGGVLLVADLVDDLMGQTHLQIVNVVPTGYGAGALVVLPGREPTRRDVVAVLAGDAGELLVYDDDTGDRVYVGRDGSGHPFVGAAPFGLAVDPVPSAGLAHVYVASFEESFVTPIDVPLADINGLDVTIPRHITGGTP